MGRQRRNKGRAVHGIVLLDKPTGISSNAALQRVKRIFNANKAGHTGSLDPLATGVLPLCLGEATKISQFLLDSDKSYRATIKLGERTDSGDCEGKVIQSSDVDVSESDILQVLKTLSGEIEQLPPMYSALKHNGVPLYKLARAGKTVERKRRRITVFRNELISFNNDEVVIEVDCSKGTYIRTIADDLGEILGCSGHITALRRLKAGMFTEHQCATLEDLQQWRESSPSEDDFSTLDKRLIKMDTAVESLPVVNLPTDTAAYIKQGQPVIVRHLPAEGLVRLYDEDEFIGIGIILDDGRVAPKRLLVS